MKFLVIGDRLFCVWGKGIADLFLVYDPACKKGCWFP